LNDYNIGHYANESEPYIEPWSTPFKQSIVHDGSILFHSYIKKGTYQGKLILSFIKFDFITPKEFFND